MTAHFYLTRREFGKIPGSLMLIRCLSCETGAHFVSIVALNLKKLRILRCMRLECSSEILLIGLITRRSQVQVLSPQPVSPKTDFRMQGDLRDKIVTILTSLGYAAKRGN